LHEDSIFPDLRVLEYLHNLVITVI
jgi:hypothetical protein